MIYNKRIKTKVIVKTKRLKLKFESINKINHIKMQEIYTC